MSRMGAGLGETAAVEEGVVLENSIPAATHNSNHEEEASNEKNGGSVGHQTTLSSQRPSISDTAADDAPQDMEALNIVRSGPAHSVFSLGEKRFIVFMIAVAGFFSPLSANIYYPALETLSQELHVSSEAINLTLTSYMIFQGLAPTIFGDLADMAGRRPAYIIGFIIYLGANIGIALQSNYAALIVLRCLQSTGSSGTIALGNGVVADIATASERGTWMGWAIAGPMIGPAAGPILGGILSQFLGWRSIFWFLVIASGVFLIPFVIFFPETGRNVVGNGSIPAQGWNMSLLNYVRTRKVREAEKSRNSLADPSEVQNDAQQRLAKTRKLRWPNPLNTMKLVKEKDVGLLLAYNSIVYVAFMNVAASATYLFADVYNFNDLQVGLSFIPFGFGAFCAPLVNGRALDWNYKRMARKVGMVIDKKRGDDLKDFPLERTRIEVALPLLAVGCATILCYGWVMQIRTNLAAPLILFFIMGLTLTGAFNVMNVLLVDLYPGSPATATAANNLVRCLVGAVGSAVIIRIIQAWGAGWCFTFHAALVAVFSPILIVLMRKGPKWREERRLREKAKG